MKYLVTGGAGFIGSHIVQKLVERGDDVSILDNLSTGSSDKIIPGATFFEHDIRDKAGLEEILARVRPDVVFHLAAQMDVRRSTYDPVFDAECNIIGSINVIEACLKADCNRIVYSNTGGALYGEVEASELPVREDHEISPLSQYGISKHTVEHYLHLYSVNHGLEYTSLRFPNVYGPRQDPHGEAGVIAIFLGKMVDDQPITIFGDGTNARDYTYVADIASAALLASSLGGRNVFNVGTGLSTTVLEIASALAEITGYSREPEFAPAREGEIPAISLDASKAAEELGWRPETDLKIGLGLTLSALTNGATP